MSRERVPEKFERWAGLWDLWSRLLEQKNISPVTVCLAYLLSYPQVDRVVVGVDSCAQLRELVSAAKQVLIDSDFDFVATNDEHLINPSNWDSL